MASTHIYPVPRRRRRRGVVSFTLPRLSFTLPRLSFTLPTRSVVLAAIRDVSLRSWIRRLSAWSIVGRLGHERVVAVAAAGILLGASVLSVTPGRATGDTGGPSGDGPQPRLAVAGSDDGDDVGSVEDAYIQPTDRSTEQGDPAPPLGGLDPVEERLLGRTPAGGAAGAEGVEVATTPETQVEGPFLEDGTLLKPVAVDTTVADGRELIRTYKVKAGDTLATIADRFDVSTMTLWWANDLKSKNALVRGQVLNIPPVSGLVVTVKATDTLAGLARRYKLSEEEILTTNGLDDPNLVVGQVLVLAGAKGAPIVTPKPKPQPRATGSGTRSTSRGSVVRQPRSYTGGRFAWPTSSRHISQYYHYGHYGIDIDGSTGNPIYAAAGGTVTFAGWKNNGGGYQVWIAHGSGLYTTYNHMSGVAVGRGQSVGKGQRVGRMGATGYATGSHLHFEVWRGPIWNGGRRVNPLAYY
jgi:murein DD-endopeptidase MepM/ murein hydrolase activator NlpD